MRVITPYTYHSDPADRALADQVMRRLDLDPGTVSRIEVSEGGIVIEQLVLDDPRRWHGERRSWRV